MLKLLGLVVLLASVFSLGLYVGQRPGEFKKTVQNLSRNVMDATLGVERNLKFHQGLANAKARVAQVKAELLDRNYGNATKELSEVILDLEKASAAEQDSGRASKVRTLAAKAREAQQELSLGKGPPRAKLDEIDKELTGLLGQ